MVNKKSINHIENNATKTALYRHYNAKGKLLYVGISLSAASRLLQHSISAHWFLEIANVTIEHFDNRQYALEAEQNAIKLELPLFNKYHNHVIKCTTLKTSELKKLIGDNSVEKIVFSCLAHKKQPAPIWDVYCYDFPGSSVCKNFGGQLLNNNGTQKTYTSLDRAMEAIQALGYKRKFWIEG